MIKKKLVFKAIFYQSRFCVSSKKKNIIFSLENIYIRIECQSGSKQILMWTKRIFAASSTPI